jgi:uncharacterized protein YbjT (DUF2867 family)
MQGRLGFRAVIAAVAAASLTQDGHEGKIYDITGSDSPEPQGMASQLPEALGKTISFVDIPTRRCGARC